MLRKKRLIFGSYGSEDNGIGKFAWSLLDVNNLSTPLIIFLAPVHGDTDQVTAIRAELFGLFACLHYIHYIVTKFKLKPAHLPVFSYCTNAILAATQPFFISCKTVTGDDTDIRAELRHIYKKVHKYVQISHVKSHKNDLRTLSQLSPAAILNVSLDRYMKNSLTPTMIPHKHMVPHLPCQKISLCNDYDRLTNNYPTFLTIFSVEYEVEQIIAKSWKLTHDNMTKIHCSSFSRTIKSYSQFRQFAITK